MREFYRNKQPHFQAHQTVYSITILAHDAVPYPVIDEYKHRRDSTLLDIDGDSLPDKPRRKTEARMAFEHELESLLARKDNQTHPFRDPKAAQVIKDYLLKFNGILYTLHCVAIMSNHLHFMLDLLPQLVELDDGGWSQPAVPLDTLVGRIKGGCSHAANQVLGRKGTLWMPGYYDRYIRSTLHYEYAYDYVLLNAVKAGLVKEWREHFGTWSHGLDIGKRG